MSEFSRGAVMGDMEYTMEEVQREWSARKRDLTRAQNISDPAQMRRAVIRAYDSFDKYGYPDWWALAERVLNDAMMKEVYG